MWTGRRDFSIVIGGKYNNGRLFVLAVYSHSGAGGWGVCLGFEKSGRGRGRDCKRVTGYKSQLGRRRRALGGHGQKERQSPAQQTDAGGGRGIRSLEN